MNNFPWIVFLTIMFLKRFKYKLLIKNYNILNKKIYKV